MNAHPRILNIKKCTACYVSKCLPWIIKHTSCSGCFHCAAAVWVYSKIWNQIWTQSTSFLYQKIWVFGRAAVLNLNDSKTVRIYSGCFSTPLSQDLTHDSFFFPLLCSISLLSQMSKSGSSLFSHSDFLNNTLSLGGKSETNSYWITWIQNTLTWPKNLANPSPPVFIPL